MWFLFLLPLLAFAHDNALEHKKGFVIGVGGAYSKYDFPSDFNGSLKNKIDNTAGQYGGVLQFGYDVVIKDRLLLGLRGEGLTLDTLGTGNKEGNSLKGRTRSATGLIRAGILFQAKFWDLVGDPAPLMVEPFVEAGISSGHRSFVKQYDPSGSDIYVDNLEEEFQGRNFNFGLNFMNGRGGFFEVKGMYTNITNTHQKFTGHKSENGGGSIPTDRNDDKNEGFFTWAIVFGQHF
ncbi:MAG: hypothetical protein ACJ76H_12160 [Bacteriovoracaceae bacterium]